MLAVISLLSINSCKKKTNDDIFQNKDVVAERTNVKTYEIISLISHESLADKYTGTFGTAAVELLKTSDTTLTFFVPDVAEGDAVLKFDLANINFNVTKTIGMNAADLVDVFNQRFDYQISELNATTAEEIAEVNSISQYKQEVFTLFNSLSDEEKQQAILFYEANKGVFQSFEFSVFRDLNASTTMKMQSDCPRTDFYSFYGCTAENLGNAAIGLRDASIEFLEMAVLAGASAWLAPASFGLSVFGTTLAAGTAAYLLIAEVRPAALRFKYSLYPFLNANWIFTKALFQATTDVFQDQISKSLNLKPAFRSITANDGVVNSGTEYFLSSMATLSEYWNKMTALFGDFPLYKNTESPTTLATNEVVVSNISNSNVKYLGNSGQNLTFKSMSGNEESFSYNVRVMKQGFVEETVLNGKVIPVTDSTAIYEAACIGWWTVKGYDPNNPTTTYNLELSSNGGGTYHIPGSPTTYSTRWEIKKVGTEYRLYESGFWHPAYDGLTRDRLTYPVTIFKTYANFDPNFVSQEYIKN